MSLNKMIYSIALVAIIGSYNLTAFANGYNEDSDGNKVAIEANFYKKATLCMEVSKKIEDERSRAQSLENCFKNYKYKLTSYSIKPEINNCMNLADQVMDYSEFHPIYVGLYGSGTSVTESVSSKTSAQLSCIDY